MSEGDELTDLRNAIAEVDQALLELLHRRLELAAAVGRTKAETGAPIVVRDVEDRIYTRARHHATACGVSEEVMEAIFSAIIRGSVERQHRVGVALRAKRGGRVLIIGGAGAMGSWFANFLHLVGHQVAAVDPAWKGHPRAPGRHAELEELTDLDSFDFVIIAVPLASTPSLIERVAARRPRGVIVEIASIKAHLAGALADARKAGVSVSSLHPMFGPGRSPYEPLTFVLGLHEDEQVERKRIEGLLQHPYTHVVTMPFSHHDKLMGWLLGLAHLSSMLFGAALAHSGLPPSELEECASTTFRRQADTSLSVLSEDPELYLDIQRLNPHRHEVYEAARAALEELVDLVRREDREGFRETLALARKALTTEE